MENQNIISRVAIAEDKEKIYQLIDWNCEAMPENIVEAANYKQVADHVLNDIDWGFMIIA